MRLVFEVTMKTEDLSNDVLTKWFKDMQFFKPKKMRVKNINDGKQSRYNKVIFEDALLVENINEHLDSISIKDKENSLVIRNGAYEFGISKLYLRLESSKVENHFDDFLMRLHRFIYSNEIIVAYFDSWLNQMLNNTSEITMYKAIGGEMSNVSVKAHSLHKGQKEIDLELNPSHCHIKQGIWFGVSWMMWFGAEYYDFIPRKYFEKVTACEVEETSDVLFIKLYDDINDYRTGKGVERQWHYRKVVHLDEIVHRLPVHVVNINRDKSQIEILSENNKKYVVSYLDEQNKPTSKEKSVSVVKQELNYD